MNRNMKNKRSFKKPDFLYHGSSNGEIEEFKPEVSLGTGEVHGPQVYASHDIATASIFMANIKKSWSAGEFDGVLYAVIPLDREEFIKTDNGGFIYKVSGGSFSINHDNSMGDKEWSSSVPVKPLEKTRFGSVLDAMIENGVQVYFVTDEQYKKMSQSGKPKWQFLKDLKSENQLRMANVKSF